MGQAKPGKRQAGKPGAGGMLRFIVPLVCAIPVFFYAAHWFEVQRFDLKLEIGTKITQPGQWMVEYDYSRNPNAKKRRVIQYRKTITETCKPCSISFPVPKRPRIKRIRIYPGIGADRWHIRSLRFASIGPGYDWSIPALAKAAEKGIPPGSGYRVIEFSDGVQIIGDKTGKAGGNPPGLLLDTDIKKIYYTISGHPDRKKLLKLPAAGIAILSVLLFFVILPSDYRYLLNRIRSLWRASRKGPVQNRILAAGFIAAVFFPAVVMFTGDGTAVDNAEKRGLARRPVFQFSTMWQFPGRYRQFFNDHFPFRGPMIRLNNIIQVKAYKKSPVPKVFVGKNGWLFYRSELAKDGNTIQDYQGDLLFTEPELKRIKKNIERKIVQCRRADTHLLIILIPNKETVYSEYMPHSIKKGALTRFHQLKQLCKRNPHFPVLFLTDTLMAKKKERQLYYTGGTHWNQYGAFYGYETVMNRLSKYLPQLKPYPLEAFDIICENNSAYDHWFGFKEHRHYRFRLKNPLPEQFSEGRQKLKAVAFRDSFIQYFPHFYKNHFEPFIEISNHGYNHEAIKKYKPDVVIYEIIERASHLLLEKK